MNPPTDVSAALEYPCQDGIQVVYELARKNLLEAP